MNFSALRRWSEQHGFGFLLLPWLPTALGCFFLKYDILRNGGFHEAAIGLHVPMLTVRDRILLFRLDLLFCFLLVPLFACCLCYFLRPSFRLVLSATLSAVVHTLLLLETVVYESTGSFSSVRTIWDAAVWALQNRAQTLNPLSRTHLAELSLWVVLFVATSWIAFFGSRRSKHSWDRASLTFFGAMAIASMCSFAVHFPKTAWDMSLLKAEIPSAFTEDTVDRGMWMHQPPDLMRLYRTTANAPASSRSPYFGQARGYNVVLFVLEAIPAEVFDPAKDSLADMPNARFLRQHAFVGASHYTSFPLTNRAAFSIFTSLYTKCAAGCTERIPDKPIPNVVSTLQGSGYQTGYYGYVWKTSSARDDRMLSMLGFGKVVEPAIDQAEDRDGLTTFMGPLEYTERHDREVLARLREDIRTWTTNRQPFFAAFFPEFSHDPWRTTTPDGPTGINERGHALAVHQDKWLGEILDELRNGQALDNTIIVVTADHGLRFRTSEDEDKSDSVGHGMLDELMLRVPLLVYVPKVLNQTISVQQPTSHIDIAPSLLDLLGIDAHREYEQGTPLWIPGIAKRRLYLSMDQFGASGYFENGSFYMRSTMKTVFKSNRMQFADSDALSWDSSEALNALEILDVQDSLQNALLKHLNLCPGRPGRIPQGN